MNSLKNKAPLDDILEEYHPKYHILMLISDTGGGHRSSAEALALALQRFNPHVCAVIVDIWTEHGSWPFNIFVPAYKYLCEHPPFWRILYNSTQTDACRYIINSSAYTLCSNQFCKLFKSVQPHLVCSIHPLCQHIPLKLLRTLYPGVKLDLPENTEKIKKARNFHELHINCISPVSTDEIVVPDVKSDTSKDDPIEYQFSDPRSFVSQKSQDAEKEAIIEAPSLNRKDSSSKDLGNIVSAHRPRIPFLTVITDLGEAHPFWFSKDVDLCFVASDEIEQAALKYGLSPSRIRKYGLPLRQPFWNVRHRSKPLARKALRLQPHIPMCLLIGGGDGVGNLESFVKKLVKNIQRILCGFSDVQLVVVCGKNQALKETLESYFRDRSTLCCNESMEGAYVLTSRSLYEPPKKPSQKMDSCHLKNKSTSSLHQDCVISKSQLSINASEPVYSSQPKALNRLTQDELYTSKLWPPHFKIIKNGPNLWGNQNVPQEASQRTSHKITEPLFFNLSDRWSADKDSCQQNKKTFPRNNIWRSLPRDVQREGRLKRSASHVPDAYRTFATTSFKGDHESSSCQFINSGLRSASVPEFSHLQKNCFKEALSLSQTWKPISVKSLPDVMMLSAKLKCLALRSCSSDPGIYKSAVPVCEENLEGKLGNVSNKSSFSIASNSNLWNSDSKVSKPAKKKSFFLGAMKSLSCTTSETSLKQLERENSASNNFTDIRHGYFTNKTRATKYKTHSKQSEDKKNEESWLASVREWFGVPRWEFFSSLGTEDPPPNTFVLDNKRTLNKVIVKVLPFVSNIHTWMEATDILITKAGPGTIAEGCMYGLPILIYFYLPGQEEGNVSFVTKNGIGAYSSNPTLLAYYIKKLLISPEKRKEVSMRARQVLNPNATQCIARDILDILYHYEAARSQCLEEPSTNAT